MPSISEVRSRGLCSDLWSSQIWHIGFRPLPYFWTQERGTVNSWGSPTESLGLSLGWLAFKAFYIGKDKLEIEGHRKDELEIEGHSQGQAGN
jgi:hypothetical protein